MELSKKLESERNRLAELRYPDNVWPRFGEQYRITFKEGFSEACNLLLPEIKKLKSTIDNAAKYLESCGYNNVDQSEPEFQMLQTFYNNMQSLEEFLNGGENE